MSYYVLKLMSLVGLVRDLRTPSKRVLSRSLVTEPVQADTVSDLAVETGES